MVSGVIVEGRDGRKGSGAEVIMGSSESNLLFCIDKLGQF